MNRFRICRTLVKLGWSAATIVALAVVGGAARAQTEHTVLAYPALGGNMLAEFVAEDSHLWEKQGLEVKVVHIAGVGATNALISKSVDSALPAGVVFTRASARGQKLVVLFTGLDQAGVDVVVRKDIAVAVLWRKHTLE